MRSLRRTLGLSIAAGLVAGTAVGVTEAAVVLWSAGGGLGSGGIGAGVLLYGALAYALFCAGVGAALGFPLAALRGWTSRLRQRTWLASLARWFFPPFGEERPNASPAEGDALSFARWTSAMAMALGWALAVFRIRRDIFHETMSKPWLVGVALLCALVALALGALLCGLLARVCEGKARFLLRPWGALIPLGIVALIILPLRLIAADRATGNPSRGGEQTSASEDAPNILVIVVDTLRADHLPLYGYDAGSTPHLEALSEDAVVYEYAFANASWTRPSFASILTGRYASSHGVMAKSDALPDALTTLPEALRAGGYTTAGLVTNFNVGPYFNFHQGFDQYRFLEPEFVLGADDTAAKLLLMQFVRRGIERARAMRGTVEPGTAYQDAETVNRHILSWLDTAPPAPFFLFVGYMDPHDPYFEHPYSGEGYARAAHPHPSLDEAAHLRRLYDGEITYFDTHLGALMDALKERGFYDDTLIVLTSDHGEEFGEHGGFWHGTTLYDEQLRVPLIVKYAGNRRAGTRVRHWVESVDLMPTILQTVGIEPPPGIQGTQLSLGSPSVYAEEHHEGNILHSLRQRRGMDSWKVITANPNNPRGLQPLEVYRPDVDPTESNNLSDTDRARAQGLVSALDLARTAAAEGAVDGNAVDMDEETTRQLCRLGYADRETCCERGLLPDAQCNTP